MSNGTIEEHVAKVEGAKRVSDPELKAMANMLDELESLGPKQRRRVATWVLDRLGLMPKEEDFSDI